MISNFPLSAHSTRLFSVSFILFANRMYPWAGLITLATESGAAENYTCEVENVVDIVDRCFRNGDDCTAHRADDFFKVKCRHSRGNTGNMPDV